MSEIDVKEKLQLLIPEEIARLRKVSLGHLANERSKGVGPEYQKIGGKVFYPLDKLKKFLAASTVTPPSPATMANSSSKRAARR
jgi:hypothetical protein